MYILAVMTLSPGDSFDRYVIQEPLGQGGMGAVYRARDPKLQRSVALKVLAFEGLTGPASQPESEGHARLLREARAVAALDHPNVVAVFDVGEVAGAPFIAMELVEGRSLRAFIGDTQVPAATRVSWLVAVAAGLQAAHERGLVHRDVKPENVMVRKDGVVKVLDFGIARRATSPLATDATALPTITGAGMVVGTVTYMAPEQLHGERLDGRADQFSWGVMAYELLGGARPWGGAQDAVAVVAAIVSKDAEPLRGVPEAMSRVVLRALSKKPEDRFPTMADAAAALEAASRMTGADAAFAATEMAPAATRSRPRRRSMLAPVVLVLAGAAAVAFAVSRGESAKAPAESSASPSSSAPLAKKPVACSDAPIPESKSVEAVAAYRAGLQALCDANYLRALDSFQSAVDLDPAMAAAYVRLAELESAEIASRAVESAQQLRASLSAYDRDLLGIMEPIHMRAQPDLREALARVDVALGHSPDAAEFWFLRAQVNLALEDYDATRADLAHASLLDPATPLPSLGLAYLHFRRDEEDAGVAELDHCLEIAKGASSCLESRARIRGAHGDCKGLADDAEALVASAPTNLEGYQLRAEALAQQNAAPETLRATLEQVVERFPKAGRDALKLEHESVLALRAGNFVAAEAAARAGLHLLGNSNPYGLNERAAWDLARTLVEAGRLHDAGVEADLFLKRSRMWRPEGIVTDRTAQLLEVARRAGVLSKAEWIERRDQWVAYWTKVLPPKSDAKQVKLAAYIRPVETREEADDAVARLPELLTPAEGWDFSVGKAYFLAGRVDEAMPYLRRAVASCMPLGDTIETMRAQLMLGHALEQQKDKAGACAAYKAVTERWGHAKPHSVTAEDAARSATKLGCGG